MHGIEVVVVLVVVLVLVTMIFWRFRRLAWRSNLGSRRTRRNQQILAAAAADVAAMREDVKFVRRDAPGDHEDLL
jgi:cytochrome oxidase assembly protein ShyY1